MSKKLLIIAIPLGIIFLCICVCSSTAMLAYLGGRGSGNVVERDIDVSSFHKISLNGRGNIHYAQGGVPGLRVVAEDNISERIKARVVDNELIIEYERKYFWPFSGLIFPTKDIDFYVTSDDISDLVIKGSGQFSTDYIDTQNIDIVVEGAADVNISELYTQNFSLKVDGASDVDIEGIVSMQEVIVNGASDYNAINLKSDKCKIEINGAGDASVNVTEKLDAIINGTGTIQYTGNPIDINREVNGIGEIVDIGD